MLLSRNSSTNQDPPPLEYHFSRARKQPFNMCRPHWLHFVGCGCKISIRTKRQCLDNYASEIYGLPPEHHLRGVFRQGCDADKHKGEIMRRAFGKCRRCVYVERLTKEYTIAEVREGPENIEDAQTKARAETERVRQDLEIRSANRAADKFGEWIWRKMECPSINHQ